MNVTKVLLLAIASASILSTSGSVAAPSDNKSDISEKKAFDGKGLYGEKFATRPLIFWSNISGGTVTVRVWGLKFGSSGPPDLSRPPMVLECTLPCKIDVPVHTQFQILVSPPEGRKLRSGLEVPPAWRDGLFLVQLQPNELKLVFE